MQSNNTGSRQKKAGGIKHEKGQTKVQREKREATRKTSHIDNDDQPLNNLIDQALYFGSPPAITPNIPSPKPENSFQSPLPTRTVPPISLTLSTWHAIIPGMNDPMVHGQRTINQTLADPPLPLSLLARTLGHGIFVLHLIQIALCALRATGAGIRAEVLAEMFVALGFLLHSVLKSIFILPILTIDLCRGSHTPLSYVPLKSRAQGFAAKITHRVSADTCQFVASRRFDKGEAAARAGAFNCGCPRGFDRVSERQEQWLVALMRIGPGLTARNAAESTAGRIRASKAFVPCFDAYFP
jgi:hypothetical protein